MTNSDAVRCLGETLYLRQNSSLLPLEEKTDAAHLHNLGYIRRTHLQTLMLDWPNPELATDSASSPSVPEYVS